MRFSRRGTVAGQSPYGGVNFTHRTSKVVKESGATAFEQAAIVAPEHWSHIAVDILATKYFRKTGVATVLRRVAEADMPEWLWRAVPD